MNLELRRAHARNRQFKKQGCKEVRRGAYVYFYANGQPVGWKKV